MLCSVLTSDSVDPTAPRRGASVQAPPFSSLYDAHFAFVWRNLRRLGVRHEQLDDAAQDTFLVVFRRLEDFQGHSSLRTWLFGILLRVARDHRRRAARRPTAPLEEEPAGPDSDGPEAQARVHEASRRLHRLLESLDEDRRAVFVMAELEQMSVPEIAETIGANVNTVYSRLRLARRDFEAALARDRARRPK
jgi:RNA polymerase sigma-70 factor (ECF subfamily)